MVFTGFTLILISCNPSDKSKEHASPYFFSFKNYFKKQADELNRKNSSVRKTIIKSGEQETKEMTTIDWEKELRLFSDADLNKNAWIPLYKTDTLKTDSSTTISYTAIDSTLQIRHIAVVYIGDIVNQVSISSSFKNFYYESHLQLDYRAGESYQIKGEQAIRFAKRQAFEIKCEFLK